MTQNLIGKSIERYNILSQIGEGGMATVYKAHDTRLNRAVALKVIRTEKLTLETMGKTLKRFEREARALAKLNHPHIVPVMDFGEYEGRPFLVMPFISGGTLKERLGRPIPWQESARLLIPIARALQYAHQQRIVHRDVKPSNILLASSGDSLLTDFGIAKILADTEETSDLTGTGMGIGTPEYMSPEQFQGTGVDARTDVYSLGVVFYEMVTGKKPYTAKTPAAIMVKQATEALPRPSAFVPGIPGSVEKTLLKALAKKPEDRFPDMGRFLRALEAIAQGKEIPISEITSTVTRDDSYDTFQTHQIIEPTYSTVDQNAHQRTVNQYQTPVPPRSKSGWGLPLAAGGLVLCVLGFIAVAMILLIPSDNTPYAPEPSPYEQPISDTPIQVYESPIPVQIDSSASTDVPSSSEPTREPTPTEIPTCPGVPKKYPTLIKADREARVCTQYDRLIVRRSASMSASEVLSLYPETYVRILEGPVCADNYWWWKVEIHPGTPYSKQGESYSQTWTTNRTYYGWAREGWDKTDSYFLCQ